jgi:prepilin-type N-terminal cleavage/methylation domain-containing protein
VGGGAGGFSLVELVVASVVLALGLLGTFSLALVAQRGFVEAGSREWAARRAGALVDSLALTRGASSGTTRDSFGVAVWEIAWDGGARRLEIELRSAPGDTVRYSTLLSPEPAP